MEQFLHAIVIRISMDGMQIVSELSSAYENLLTNEVSTTAYPCDQFAQDYALNVTTLISYNSWIGSNCTAGLYEGIVGDDTRSVCVGINGTTSADSVSKLADSVQERGVVGAIKRDFGGS